jgi:DNA-binding transcriptional MerR regulator
MAEIVRAAVREYFTTADVAELCRTSPETVRYWRHTGYGPPSFRVGRRVLYAAAEVERWLAEIKATQAAAAE